MQPMTGQQRRQVFRLCRELGWDDAMRRDMIREWTGKPSLAADAPLPVTEAEARIVLQNLATAVAQVRRERRRRGMRQRRIWRRAELTPEHLHRIGALRRHVFGENAASFAGWLQKCYDTDDPARLTARQASAAIVGLERMKEQGWKPGE